jgi:hypothetical protein
MSIAEEFATVSLILNSQAETRGVDAFALSLIKAERQVRKLVTHLVYQFPVFGPGDVSALRGALGASRRVYFEGFLAGFDALYSRSVQELVGSEYARLKGRVDEAIDHRNKIFHGQLTARSLTRQDLVDLATDIKVWCTTLGAGAGAEVGHDGFGRNSFQKSAMLDLWKRCRVQFGSVADYQAFISAHMDR